MTGATAHAARVAWIDAPLPTAAALIGAAAALAALSHVVDAPAIETCAILMLAGLVWMRLPRVSLSGRLGLVFAVGLAMRLLLFGSAPILEIDYLRYLWDGAAVAHGLNPFAVAPSNAILGDAGAEWRALVVASDGVAEAINYGHLATIYPGTAQAVFWLAHQLDPWGLTGLRTLFLLSEIAGFALLVQLLRALGRPPEWAALYWWNPLIAVQLINAAHMDALLPPLLVGAALFAMRGRTVAGCALLGLAAGVKVWPLVLAPLILLPRLRQGRWGEVMLAAAVALGVAALAAAPAALGRLDAQSGFVAYAAGWERNDAAFGLLRAGVDFVLAELGEVRADPGRLTRMLVVVLVSLCALALGWRARTAADLPRNMLVVSALLFLLSPTGYPWYYVWLAPFLCVAPSRGLMLLTVMLPIYYLRFVFAEQGAAHLFDGWVVWIEFGPVFALLAYDALVRRAADARPPAAARLRAVGDR